MAFTAPLQTSSTIRPTTLFAEPQSQDNEVAVVSRRHFMVATMAATAMTTLMVPTTAWAAPGGQAQALLADLEASRLKLDGVPKLLQNQEWDAVRSILKTPPVNYLWNMGDSRNPVLALAKATETFELVELKDEIAISLQMCDQLAYDNVFLPFQPGNGKIKIKEPVDLAMKAMKQIDEAIQMAKDAQ